MTKMIDLTGQKFNRLTVIDRAQNTAKGQARWLCQCVCGKTYIANGTQLRKGRVQSCGCYKREVTIEHSTKHGHANAGQISPTYHSWAGMIARCTNSAHRSYSHYGGNGIVVCERWYKFANFLADMGEKPKGHSLDRVDYNGNYEPDNCRWATVKEQARNKRTNRLITLNGITRTMGEWVEILGVPQSTISYRVQHNYSDEQALLGKL